jgi:ribonuclease T2
MKSKNLIRIVLSLLVAAFGAWQLNNNQSSPDNNPRQHQGNQQSHKQGQPHANQQGNRQGASNHSNQAGDFDYYVVSLSWSPAYCSTHPNDKRQCGERGFGFVLHGVWPQKSAGGYPQDCPVNSQPSNATIQKTLAFMPSEKLINHEWAKHGTCTGLSADEYFTLADRAFGMLKIPAAFQAPSESRSLSADQIEAEFINANPQITANQITVSCSAGELSEIRVCVDTQLKPTDCGKGVKTQCGRDTVQIRSMR